MAEIGVAGDAVHARRRRERRVHQHHRRPDVAEPVGDGLGVERCDHGLGKQLRQQARPDASVFVEMERARRPIAQRALRRHRQHPGAGGGFQHDVARPDRGGLERGIGERQRGRELLEPHLFLGSPGVRGLQRGEGLQHRQHAPRPAGAGVPAHAPAVALHEDDDGRFGGLVGVLPDPTALGVGRSERARHGVPQGRGIERAAGLQNRQQGPGRGEQSIARHRAGRLGGWIDGDGGRKRTRESVRRLRGVEHWAVSVLEGRRAAAGGRREFSRASPPDCPRSAGRTPAGARRARETRRERVRRMRSGSCGRAWGVRAAQGRLRRAGQRKARAMWPA